MATDGSFTSLLNELHRQQVLNYLRLFRKKGDEHLQEVSAAFKEAKDSRLGEDMYSKDEVNSIIDCVQENVKSTVHSEVDKYTEQNALMLHQLLLQAEGNSATLTVDMARLDDAKLLEGIKSMEAQKDLPAPVPKKLASLGQSAVDVKLVTKMKEQEEANQHMRARFEKLQEQCKAALKENSQLKESQAELSKRFELLALEYEALRSGRNAAEAQLASAQSAGASADHELKSLMNQLKSTQDQLNDRINNSAPFKQLRKVLDTRNKQLRELRSRLKKYEPDAVVAVEADDDDS